MPKDHPSPAQAAELVRQWYRDHGIEPPTMIMDDPSAIPVQSGPTTSTSGGGHAG